MSRAWQASAPVERLGDARPGALLAAAAAVPLGAAVLIAAGLLPGGARVAVGVAVAVLGARILALDGTVLGARVRPPTVRGIGVALTTAGIVLAVAAVGGALDGGRLESPGAFDFQNFEPALSAAGAGPYGAAAALGTSLDGWAAVAFGALLAAAGTGLVRDARFRTPATALAGVGAAAAVVALTGGGVVGLGADARAFAVLAVAAVGVAVAWRRPADDAVGRAVGIAGGLLVALLVGEATGVVRLLASTVLGAPFVAPTREGTVAAVLLVAAALSVALLALAARRRDVALGLLPAGTLLLSHPVDTGVGQVGVLLVPALLVGVAGAAVLGRAAALRVVPRPAAPALLAVAALGLLVALDGAIEPTSAFLQSAANGFAPEGTREGRLAVAIAGTLGVLAVAGLAVRSDGTAGIVAAVACLLGLHLLHPLALFRAAAPDSFLADGPSVVVAAIAEVALGLLVARRHLAPPVLFAAGLLVVSGLESVAFGIALSGNDVDGTLLTALTYGPAALAVVALAAAALAGPDRRVGLAQAAAAGALLGALLLGDTATIGLVFGGEEAGPTLDGGEAVLAVALVTVLGLGVALLAATTARRPSPPLAAGVAAATASLAVLVAAVGAAVADTRVGSSLETITAPALQVGFGFDGAGSVLQRTGAGWPVLLGVLGAVLLGAAWWLESRRPLPPDAPVG